MSPIPFRAKRDANESEIIAAFYSEGWGVIRLSERGVPDLLVYDHRGSHPVLVALVEVKSAKGDLTSEQERFWVAHRDLPKFIARSEDDAREISRQLRHDAGPCQACADEATDTPASGARR